MAERDRPHMAPEIPRHMRWLSRRLLRGPHAELVRHDLRDLYVRDRENGLSASHAARRYRHRLLSSAVAMWRDDAEWPGVEWWREFRRGHVFRDMRFACRLSRTHPAPAGVVVCGLAVAIAFVTSVFTIVDAAIFRPFGMDDPASIVSVGESTHGGWPYWPYATVLRMQREATAGQVEATLTDNVRWSIASSADPGRGPTWISFVTGGYLSMLGGRPALGRTLDAADATPGAPLAAVVSHDFWTAALDADPALVGQTIWLNGTPATLVGVLRRGFTGPMERPSSIWTPVSAYHLVRGGPPFTPQTMAGVEVVARLARGNDRSMLQQQLSAIVSRVSNVTEPGADLSKPGVLLFSAASPIDGREAADMYAAIAVIFALVGLVLAIACANASNLLLAAGTTRQREMGVRLALGATRLRLVRQILHESLLLAFVAAAVALVLTIWLVPVLASVVQIPRAIDAAPDWRAFAFAIALAVACGIGAGFSPARHARRGAIVQAIASQSAQTTSRSRIRSSFVGFQVAVSTLLLVVAALLTHTAIRLTRIDVGYDIDRLLAVSFEGPTGFDAAAYAQVAQTTIRGLPGIENASLSQYQPFGPSVEKEEVVFSGRSYQIDISRSDARYLSTLGIRVRRGRGLTDDDITSQAPVALISDSVARTFFAGSDPLGQSIDALLASRGAQRESATIVGIVSDAMLLPLSAERGGAIYLPVSRTPANPPVVVARTANPGRAARIVEDALRTIDADVRATTRIPRERLDAFLGAKRMFASLVVPTALLAATLATVGVFGVTAFVVGLRGREVGLRVALGATTSDVLRLLMIDGLQPVVCGAAIGLLLALLASAFLASEFVSGISPYDPISLAGSVLLMLTAGGLAVLLPARRALRLDPAYTLREN